MDTQDLHSPTNRRGFLGSLAVGAAALSMPAMAAPFAPQKNAAGITGAPDGDPDVWFNEIKGKHRVVFDCIGPKEIFPFVWPRVFLLTNAATGTTEKDCSVVVILRHEAIPYAMQSSLWEKYKFGEMFKADDPQTKAPAVRNPFWMPKRGDYKVPGFGEVAIGINELQESGVRFCVCNAALTVYSAAAGMKMNMDGAAVKKEWTDGLLPNIQIVPSGVWAAGRAQEHGCAYIFVG